jgi:hypothetical protein
MVCEWLDATALRRLKVELGLVLWLEAINERVALYAVMNFIEAHEHAERRLHSFIGREIDTTYAMSEGA